MNIVTYSLEDNKIRIYFEDRIPKEEWDVLKKAGYSWTMKQASDLVATWTPHREDLALLYTDTIQDEESTIFDRSADRAERFSGYLENRIADTEKYSSENENDIGFESSEKAEKLAKKIEKKREKANVNFSKAEYWQTRINAVINHAIFKDSPDLRQNRIRTLKKDLASPKKYFENYQQRIEKYSKLTEDEFQGLNWQDKSKLPTRLEYIEKLVENQKFYKRWVDHILWRIDFETKVLEKQGFGKKNFDYKVGGIIEGQYQITKINKNRGEINSFTCTNLKQKFTEGYFNDKIVKILIEKVQNYEPPAEDFKPEKKDSCPVLNLSREKLREILGSEIKIVEITSEEWQKNTKSSDFYGAFGFKDGDFLSAFETKRNKCKFKIRAYAHWQKNQREVYILTDKKFQDDKAIIEVLQNG